MYYSNITFRLSTINNYYEKNMLRKTSVVFNIFLNNVAYITSSYSLNEIACARKKTLLYNYNLHVVVQKKIT